MPSLRPTKLDIEWLNHLAALVTTQAFLRQKFNVNDILMVIGGTLQTMIEDPKAQDSGRKPSQMTEAFQSIKHYLRSIDPNCSRLELCILILDELAPYRNAAEDQLSRVRCEFLSALRDVAEDRCQNVQLPWLTNESSPESFMSYFSHQSRYFYTGFANRANLLKSMEYLQPDDLPIFVKYDDLIGLLAHDFSVNKNDEKSIEDQRTAFAKNKLGKTRSATSIFVPSNRRGWSEPDGKIWKGTKEEPTPTQDTIDMLKLSEYSYKTYHAEPVWAITQFKKHISTFALSKLNEMANLRSRYREQELWTQYQDLALNEVKRSSDESYRLMNIQMVDDATMYEQHHEFLGRVLSFIASEKDALLALKKQSICQPTEWPDWPKFHSNTQAYQRPLIYDDNPAYSRQGCQYVEGVDTMMIQPKSKHDVERTFSATLLQLSRSLKHITGRSEHRLERSLESKEYVIPKRNTEVRDTVVDGLVSLLTIKRLEKQLKEVAHGPFKTSLGITFNKVYESLSDLTRTFEIVIRDSKNEGLHTTYHNANYALDFTLYNMTHKYDSRQQLASLDRLMASIMDCTEIVNHGYHHGQPVTLTMRNNAFDNAVKHVHNQEILIKTQGKEKQMEP
ncbi:hypothetical protein AB6D11_06010 [Vibrio splendidus]